MRKLLISGLLAAMAARAVPIQLQSSTLQIAASSTIVTLQLNTVPTIAVGNYAVVGGEFTLIRAYNGAQLTVSRAQSGTVGASHAIGTVTWIAPSGATISADPVGACTRSTMPYAPVLSYATGTAWDCIGSVWTAVTPGFYDSGLPGYRNIRGTAAARASTACDIGDKYFTTDSAPGQNLYGCTATNTWTLLSGGGGSGAFSALTGGTNTTAAMVVGSGASIGVTGSGSNTATALTAGATAAGRVIATAIAAPSTPSAGTGAIYVDSTSKNIAVKDDAGTVKHGVQDTACGVGTFISSISAAGLATCSAAGTVGFTATPTSSTRLDVSAGDGKPGSSYVPVAATSFTLAQYPLATGANCTAATNMACTVTGTMPSVLTLSAGMTVGINGASASLTCTGLNTPHLVLDVTGQVVTFSFNSSGCGTITTTGGFLGADASASGLGYGCVTPNGEVALMMPTGAGLLVVGTGPYLNRQATSNTCEKTATGANGWYQIFTVTLSPTGNGTFGTLTAVPGGVPMLSIQAGTGMSIPCAGGVCIPAVTADVDRLSVDQAVTGAKDFTASLGLTLPNNNTLPATCTNGQVYVDADAAAGSQFYVCGPTANTWTRPSGGGGSAKYSEFLRVGTCNGISSQGANGGWQPVDGGQAFGCYELPAAGGINRPLMAMVDTKAVYNSFDVPYSWDGTSAIKIQVHFTQLSSASPSGAWSIAVALAPSFSSTFATAATQSVTVPAQNGVVSANFTPALPGGLAAGDVCWVKVTYTQNGATGAGQLISASVQISGV